VAATPVIARRGSGVVRAVTAARPAARVRSDAASAVAAPPASARRLSGAAKTVGVARPPGHVLNPAVTVSPVSARLVSGMARAVSAPEARRSAGRVLSGVGRPVAAPPASGPLVSGVTSAVRATRWVDRTGRVTGVTSVVGMGCPGGRVLSGAGPRADVGVSAVDVRPVRGGSTRARAAGARGIDGAGSGPTSRGRIGRGMESGGSGGTMVLEPVAAGPSGWRWAAPGGRDRRWSRRRTWSRRRWRRRCGRSYGR
jgi:hypothetical protein